MSTCGSMTGGRRRRTAKNKSRKMKGGNFYGAAVDPELGPGNMARPPVMNTANDNVTGGVIADPTQATKIGGRRHKRSRRSKRGSLYSDIFRGGKKSKKVTRRRKMYGGVSQILPAKASAGFTGEGSRGLADYKDVGTGMPNDVVRLA